jgi:hypothetical protein
MAAAVAAAPQLAPQQQASAERVPALGQVATATPTHYGGGLAVCASVYGGVQPCRAVRPHEARPAAI